MEQEKEEDSQSPRYTASQGVRSKKRYTETGKDKSPETKGRWGDLS